MTTESIGLVILDGYLLVTTVVVGVIMAVGAPDEPSDSAGANYCTWNFTLPALAAYTLSNLAVVARVCLPLCADMLCSRRRRIQEQQQRRAAQRQSRNDQRRGWVGRDPPHGPPPPPPPRENGGVAGGAGGARGGNNGGAGRGGADHGGAGRGGERSDGICVWGEWASACREIGAILYLIVCVALLLYVSIMVMFGIGGCNRGYSVVFHLMLVIPMSYRIVILISMRCMAATDDLEQLYRENAVVLRGDDRADRFADPVPVARPELGDGDELPAFSLDFAIERQRELMAERSAAKASANESKSESKRDSTIEPARQPVVVVIEQPPCARQAAIARTARSPPASACASPVTPSFAPTLTSPPLAPALDPSSATASASARGVDVCGPGAKRAHGGDADRGAVSCPICLETLGQEESQAGERELLRVTLCGVCLNLYHHACLVQWLSAKNSCPSCRSPVI